MTDEQAPANEAPSEGEATGTDDPGTGEPAAKKAPRGGDPVRLVTLLVLGLCVVFFLLYVRADRVMPFTTQARVTGYTVPVVPQVAGYITNIEVGLHEPVEAGQILVEIDTLQYQIGVRSARAALDNAIQQVEGADAAVGAAMAQVAAARAQEDITRRDFERIAAIRERDPTAISQADRDRAEAAHLAAIAQVEAAEADLRRAQVTLGSSGMDNPAIRAAAASLEQAELNLARATIRAPSRGAIETMFLDVGHYAAPGQPLMTFVSTAGTWISADLRENNLENLEPGAPVEVLLDVAPGTIFHGAVAGTTPDNRGSLPQVKTSTGWLRQPQQFPVVIDLVDDVSPDLLRIGAQASVMVFTGDHLINPIGRLVMRFQSIMSYLR